MALDSRRIHLVQADDLHFASSMRGEVRRLTSMPLPPGGIVFRRQGQRAR